MEKRKVRREPEKHREPVLHLQVQEPQEPREPRESEIPGELQELKELLEQKRPDPWENLPSFDLYMDQVLYNVSRQLIHFDGEILTSAMVNNYTKADLLPRAKGKRYNRVHLGYLTAIACLKQVLSVRNVRSLLDAGRVQQPEPESLYTYFCAALDQALNTTASHIDERTPREELARMALDLALESYASKVACERILELIAPPEEPHRKSRKESVF